MSACLGVLYIQGDSGSMLLYPIKLEGPTGIRRGCQLGTLVLIKRSLEETIAGMGVVEALFKFMFEKANDKHLLQGNRKKQNSGCLTIIRHQILNRSCKRCVFIHVNEVGNVLNMLHNLKHIEDSFWKNVSFNKC